MNATEMRVLRIEIETSVKNYHNFNRAFAELRTSLRNWHFSPGPRIIGIIAHFGLVLLVIEYTIWMQIYINMSGILVHLISDYLETAPDLFD